MLALAEFRRCGFADAGFGPATRLTIRVKAPDVEHIVSVTKVKTWLEGGAKGPNEQVHKKRLRELLAP